ncbi:AraC family transcriptional regulator [Accumulibacter sp.]|uniref:AraC family transcriptional regulator n=1 Tax=Accumulibacter sp. TaxID=2053492 RepID=UPI0025FB0304|nr:AraC family transcriptional regulator [Accumulibacter sp.]MCP5230162.1 AraC family transcriptional regulator ligand-binding domain-containing protein [Accumulibacter sp.]
MKKDPGAKPPLLPPSLAIGGPGEIRVGPVLAIPVLLAEFGVSPQSAFAQAGVDLRLFDDPENRIRIEVLGALLETCVALTGCAHFGLLVGERFDLQRLGPLGCLLGNSATVGEAIRGLLLHFHIHDRGAAPVLLAPDPSRVILGYSVYRHGTPGSSQILDGAMAIGHAIMAELCGPAWKALRVQFAHARPTDSAAYQRLFGANVSFDAEVSGLVFASSWLDRPIQGADPALYALVAAAIREAEAKVPMRLADHVALVLPQIVLSGMASGEVVARLFAIHPRTLRRRLEREGKSLRALITEARFELAKQLLQNTALSVAAIAAALHYEDSNAFSRAFRSWSKRSPMQWRAGA